MTIDAEIPPNASGVLYKLGGEIYLYRLEDAECAVLECLAKGLPLEQAMARASDRHPGFGRKRVAAFFTFLAGSGLVEKVA